MHHRIEWAVAVPQFTIMNEIFTVSKSPPLTLKLDNKQGKTRHEGPLHATCYVNLTRKLLPVRHGSRLWPTSTPLTNHQSIENRWRRRAGAHEA